MVKITPVGTIAGRGPQIGCGRVGASPTPLLPPPPWHDHFSCHCLLLYSLGFVARIQDYGLCFFGSRVKPCSSDADPLMANLEKGYLRIEWLPGRRAMADLEASLIQSQVFVSSSSCLIFTPDSFLLPVRICWSSKMSIWARSFPPFKTQTPTNKIRIICLSSQRSHVNRTEFISQLFLRAHEYCELASGIGKATYYELRYMGNFLVFLSLLLNVFIIP